MFGPVFDWTVAAVLIVVSILLFVGKGDFFLGESLKKRKKEEQIKYSRAMGIFTLYLAIIEIIIALTPDNTIVLMAGILAALVGLGVIGTYAKKHK